MTEKFYTDNRIGSRRNLLENNGEGKKTSRKLQLL